MTRIFITGTAGFIGFHLAKLLLAQGFRVQDYDGMTDYYDVTLKQRRHAMLMQNSSFSATEGMLEDQAKFDKLADEFEPDIIIHLAAQAGVAIASRTRAPISTRISSARSTSWNARASWKSTIC